MADELKHVRKNFVGKASMTIIKQLLDDLLEDEVLNEGENDQILEKNASRDDRARDLIDTVRRKGHKASQKMIDHLQSRDPTLFSELAADSPLKQDLSTTLLPCTQAFWRDKQKDPFVYPVTKESIKSRVALLITNIKFKALGIRNGADKDEEKMEKQLKALGYEVVKHRDLTGQAINDAVLEFSKHPKLRGTDSVIVVIMSHGQREQIVGVNWKKITSGDEKPDVFLTDNIYKHLGSENCVALLNKPKIIIIQACRGEERGSVIVSDSAHSDDPSPPSDNNIEEDLVQCVHKEKDFIAFLSCTPDTVSYRSTVDGSFLIQYLYDAINTFAHQDDIEELFRKVMQRFENFKIQIKRQMPTKDRCTLTKRFYLFPGL